ncbi:MAG: hypothetical protein JWN60_2864 [Acidobacteria bacterium]|nr:hypothetical protein [Acidobacteriota bacterium]
MGVLLQQRKRNFLQGFLIMKYCPNCQTRYTDNTLRFCLQDGTPLVDDRAESAPTVAFGETDTIVSPKQVEPVPFEQPQTSANDWVQIPANAPPRAAQPKKSRTFFLVLLTVFAAFLLLAVGGVGALLYMRSDRSKVAVNPAPNAQPPAVNSSPKANVKQSPTPTATPDNATNSNAAGEMGNSGAIAPVDAAVPVDAEEVKDQVSSVVDAWIDLTESQDINAYMNLYAPTVDYYNRRGVSSGVIRGDKQRAFNEYNSISMTVSNVNVTPDASGERATAVFDKEWVFEGQNKYSAGKVQSQLQLRKINDQWRITGERDLKVYYTE